MLKIIEISRQITQFAKTLCNSNGFSLFKWPSKLVQICDRLDLSIERFSLCIKVVVCTCLMDLSFGLVEMSFNLSDMACEFAETVLVLIVFCLEDLTCKIILMDPADVEVEEELLVYCEKTVRRKVRIQSMINLISRKLSKYGTILQTTITTTTTTTRTRSGKQQEAMMILFIMIIIMRDAKRRRE